MVVDKSSVQNYLVAKKNIMEYFKCNDDFFVRILDSQEWVVKDNEYFHMLSYWNDENRTDAIVAKKNGNPMVFRTSDYTMVVAIDCVKIAFVFNNIYEKK